ncbi:MAG: 2-phospho-L-lactate transferase CofD family protein [Chloroflexota bacterium]|nr:2-phospho-L-lactate transferase CofD family protein [Chloroflexota bacterium]
MRRSLAGLSSWVYDLAKWSYPGMHVKRWLGLLLVGLTSVALGVAFFLVQLYRTQPFPEWVYYFTLQPIDRPWRGALFLTAGVGVIALAIIQLNRSLMTAVQPPYVSDGGRLVDVVYNYRLPQRRPQVVAFAGHRGFIALQQHRDVYATKLLGVASIADGPPPPELSEQLTGATDRLLYPIDANLDLCAELEHGTILNGAAAIRARRSGVPIKRVFLVPRDEDPQRVLGTDGPFLRYVDVPVRAETLYAIREADAIIFGPGSLYLSILPSLLVRELSAAVQASRARKILVAGLMTEPGQTDHFRAADFVRALHAYGGFKLDYVLVNSATNDRLIQERYSAALATPVLPEGDGLREGLVVSAGRRLRKLSTAEGAVIVAADLAKRMVERVPVAPGEGEHGSAMQSAVVFRHDPERLAAALAALLGVSAPGGPPT